MAYGTIRVGRMIDATLLPAFKWDNTDSIVIPYSKYNIKETDFRVKTATFTSPYYMDLTTGSYIIKIESDYHENFAGFILDVEYDEDNGLYNYQCQDWSRAWLSKFVKIADKKQQYKIIRALITQGGVPESREPTKAELESFKNTLSGLKDIKAYDQSLYEGNVFKGNPMTQNITRYIKDTSYIDAIRSIMYSSAGYFDVHFSDNGIIQIDPLSKKDWENTGLMLTDNNYYNRKFKFSTTNAITAVIVNPKNDLTGSSALGTSSLLGLNLAVFFGFVGTSISNPNDQTNAVTSTSKTTTTKNTTNSTVNNKYGNPYNNKKKNIIVSADGGSGDFRSGIISKLKADGWNVKDLGTGPGTHSTSYNILNKKYSVNLTIYNGVDPKTIDEPITGWLKGRHEKYGVALVQMFDSRHWTSTVGKYNAHGQKPFRYGDFDGYRVPKAWDDNYSGARSGVLINDLGAWYKKYFPKAIHCCHPTVSGAFKQFKAGGYLRMKGIKK